MKKKLFISLLNVSVLNIGLLLFVILLASLEAQSSDCFKIDRSRPEWTDSNVVSVENAMPIEGVSIRLVAPNPFGDAINIEYELPRPDFVTITIIALNGRKIKTLTSEFLDVGKHNAQWDGKSGEGVSQPPGLYILRLKTTGRSESVKIILAK